MKHLKTYKLFEDIDHTEYESIKDYLKNIFLELEDDEFEIDIKGRFRTEEFEEFEVKIKRSKTFLLEEVYDYILTCRSYLNENGFFITDIRGDVLGDFNRRERYGLSYDIDLHEKNPEKYKLFAKPLISLEFTIRKEK